MRDLDDCTQLDRTDANLDAVAPATAPIASDRLPLCDVAKEPRIQQRIADQLPHRRDRRIDRHLV